MKSALPSPLLLIYVLVTCVSNLISKPRTGFSTVRKHTIRHRAIFEVFPYEIRLQIFEKPPCAAEALREILKILKLMENFSIFSLNEPMQFIWLRTVDFRIDYLPVLLFRDHLT
jgi:hypothetical protein